MIFPTDLKGTECAFRASCRVKCRTLACGYPTQPDGQKVVVVLPSLSLTTATNEPQCVDYLNQGKQINCNSGNSYVILTARLISYMTCVWLWLGSDVQNWMPVEFRSVLVTILLGQLIISPM